MNAYDSYHDMVRVRRTNKSALAETTPCAVAGCAEPGVCPEPTTDAPVRRRALLCATHAAERNRHHDGLAGMTQPQIEAFIRDAERGHRPLWPDLGRERSALDAWADAITARVGAFRDEADKAPPQNAETKPVPIAWRILGVAPKDGIAAARARFQRIVKDNHPDVNSHASEEDRRLLARAIAAWRTIQRDHNQRQP